MDGANDLGNVPTQENDEKLDTNKSTELTKITDYKSLYEDLLQKVESSRASQPRQKVDLDIDPSDVDLIQLAHNSYIREINKYNI